ncbi:FAD-dependent monooxygenase [Cellulomonas aerilata]|uniref:FAD-dependent oxidoreductase n=1 Tax=Cellulomonas aerilata TaxID=515326 RepID=A0A512DBZ8_9CELL|nr:FAD-dependent monooxygenase [Cellulomonas aerilata]GEO33996.1 FAD-dependent oxidoreductase [Cellulomonas aerilata]
MTDGHGGRHAVVVGAGLGGLAAAVALRRVGWAVTVLERADSFGEVGAGITLMSNGLRCLDAIGLGEVVRHGGRPQGPGGIRTPSGRWLSHLDGAVVESQLGTAAVGLHRAHLHHVLRSALPDEAVVTGATPEEVVDDGAGASVRYRRSGRSRTLPADLVVGADGVDSWVRAQRWPGARRPVYDGSTAWRAVTEAPPGDEPEFSQTWGPAQEFGYLPLSDGRLYWYAAATAPEGQREADELAEVRRRFASWHDPVPALLAGTPPAAVLRHDIYRLPPLDTYVRGRVALLGDAAHAMTPHLGQGGNQALEDAVVLAAAVSTEPDVDAALAGYDRQRRPRTQAVSRAAMWTGRFGQGLGSPGAVALRNAAVAVVPARLALRSMTRFATWKPPDLPASDPAT